MSTSWFPRLRRSAPDARRPQARGRRPIVESLEGRQLLATFTVTNVNDAGAGSLRQAILSSNTTGGTAANTIKFAVGTGLQTISPKSALPTITRAVLLDATTQPGTGTTPRITLDGANAGGATVGLTLKAPNITVKGLAIDAFAGGGVLVDGASNDAITNDFIGVTAAGNVARGNGTFGVELRNGARNNTVSKDVLSASAGNGVVITGVGSSGNVVAGDFIGTDSTGTKALPNGGAGVVINLGATGNTVGGTTPAARDVISGNAVYGVFIADPGTSGNVVEGDFLGTDATGTKALPNADGVGIANGATGNTVGGTAPGSGDLLSGNVFEGVQFSNAGTSGNLVEGDLIGTDVTGTKALGNRRDGVLFQGGGTSRNTIGGTTAAARNVISGNAVYGVLISDPGTTGNLVEGDFLGTDVTGTRALPNTDGVDIANGATGNTVGGTAPGSGNLISGNTLDGVQLSDAGTSGNLVAGNLIGTDVTGTRALGNGRNGVLIQYGPKGNTVGGTTTAARNIIAASGQDGVQIDGGTTTGNVVEGDYIGTDVTGQVALGNARVGVYLWAGANGNTIGGAVPGAGDVISGNAAHGVIIDAGSTNNVVAGDTIGLKAGGEGVLPNGGDGVLIIGGSNGNTIGGSTFTARDLISGNRANGVEINGSSNNTVAGDFIGVDLTGNFAQGNAFDGVRIDSGSCNNTIGGTVMGYSRNTISANSGYGVDIIGAGTNSNQVLQDDIGTAPNGAGALGNGLFGVAVFNGASGNIIGNGSFNFLDLIENNAGGGVLLVGAVNTLIEDDIISLNGQGQPVPRAGDGVHVQSSTGTIITACTIEANRDWGITTVASPSILSLNTLVNNGLGSLSIG